MTLASTSAWLSLALLFLSIGTSRASAQTLDLNLYQTPDGAITVNEHGDFVDPYFANRALTLADESGTDVRTSAERWISWLMARQLPDGRFQRYCKSGGSDWYPCKPSDADDAGLAVWLELLYRLSPQSGLPSAWQESARRANKYLNSLYDSNTGLYFVSHDLKVCLLMDNVEVYHLFRVMAVTHRRFGQTELSHDYANKADVLAYAITRRMWSKKKHGFLASTQHPMLTTFYPANVAQVYPWLFKMPTPAGDAKAAFKTWLSSHGDIWLNRRDGNFSWGIVALAGNQLGETQWVDRWIENSKSWATPPYMFLPK